jgi:hypothetical protein
MPVFKESFFDHAPVCRVKRNVCDFLFSIEALSAAIGTTDADFAVLDSLGTKDGENRGI